MDPVSDDPNQAESLSSNSTSHKIPRPPNSFMLFAKDYRRVIATANPGRANKEISILLGEAWKALDEKEKAKYIQEAELQRRKHRTKYPNYIYSPIEARARKAGKMATRHDEKKCQMELDTHHQMLTSPSLAQATVELCKPTTTTTTTTTTTEEKPPSLVSNHLCRGKSKVMTEIYFAPTGFEDVEIIGMEKFVTYQGKLIPYSEWTRVAGDLLKLDLNAYPDLPVQVQKQMPENTRENIENVIPPVASSPVKACSNDFTTLDTEAVADGFTYNDSEMDFLNNMEEWISSQDLAQLMSE